MQARFLLGPAGSGKTFRCLAEIRAELLRRPMGAPLVLLAPKQATFQLERQILNDGVLAGYTRLQILSFERLADFVLQDSPTPPLPLLSEEGRVMVLRALLAKHRADLKIFRASASLTGFARQLSRDLRELQRHQLSSPKLEELIASPDLSLPLRNKLHDLHLLHDVYLNWLKQQHLQDADCLLDLATESLRGVVPGKIAISELWLDGFAEMTPQELSLLAAIAPYCDKLTLAFCVNEEAIRSGISSWLSIWSGVNDTRRKCWSRLAALSEAKIDLEILPGTHPTRFSENPALDHLEKNWSRPIPFSGDPGESLRLAFCPNPQAEAVLAAREILRFVRSGGRYREAAILVRQMDGYHDDLRRVLSGYQIPFFLDRRESVSHHPVAELTRSALCTVAYEWRHDDWFGALKTGLVSENETAVDQLENEALAHGWKGKTWFSPLQIEGQPAEFAERLRERWMAPFLKLKQNLTTNLQIRPTGKQLADAIRNFWTQLRVEETLKRWATPIVNQEPLTTSSQPLLPPHGTVWQQMSDWLEDVARAFPDEALTLQEWLPILEAGLSGLTIGVIPPALDQVLIGSIDRSRNPDLKLTLILGVNESVFPCTPSNASLLTETDRDALEKCAVYLGPNTRALLSRERFFGYIACTRSRQRLVLTCAQLDAADTALNPSQFFSHLRVLFPSLEVENFQVQTDWLMAEHPRELTAPLLHAQSAATSGDIVGRSGVNAALLASPALSGLREQLKPICAHKTEHALSPSMAETLYGTDLKTSVSRLEQFAACPFRFFVDSGLRAEERRRFELDVREKGSFQHAVLAKFHEQLQAEHKRWHDLTPEQARERVGAIAAELAPQFREGLLDTDAQSRFTAQSMGKSLQEFIATIIGWMTQYEFEPMAVELGFGSGENTLPPWELKLDEGHRLIFRGIIDRIDLCPVEGKDSAMAVVVDYKSSARKLDKLLMDHGLQLQLPAYLNVLCHLRDAKKTFGFDRLIPAGVFYVNLRGEFGAGKTRDEVLGSVDDVRQNAYQHAGRMSLDALARLDNRKQSSGTQFKFKLKKNGEPYKQTPDLMTSEDFDAMLDKVEENLLQMGRSIYAGTACPDPYQKGTERACDRCDFIGICRIDPWKHSFRILREDVGGAEEGV